ncbi:MAG TPA: family 1 encapsulin nanocompartment shell protein [Alphaproteobacteria bacterium]|nr:family 1 encapsulin nanocompartment shell protein [Alphaproteobacteria bacterium]
MNSLFRDLAPISSAAWEEIDKEATRTLKTTLAARKLVDFSGPHGLASSAVGTGRSQALPSPRGGGVEARLRHVLPLVELRVPFELPRSELEAIDRGAKDPDLDPVIAAAQKIAQAEDRAVFHGYGEAGIRGICEAAPGTPLTLTRNYEDYPLSVAAAISRLREAGVDGPYAIALGRECYTGLTETTKGGYPVLQHVRRLLDGPIIWAPAVDGAVVLSMRGGDFELTVGQDISVGYLDHTAETVRLYLQESFTFQPLSPQAAVPMVYEAKAGRRTKP